MTVVLSWRLVWARGGSGGNFKSRVGDTSSTALAVLPAFGSIWARAGDHNRVRCQPGRSLADPRPREHIGGIWEQLAVVVRAQINSSRFSWVVHLPATVPLMWQFGASRHGTSSMLAHGHGDSLAVGPPGTRGCATVIRYAPSLHAVGGANSDPRACTGGWRSPTL